MELKLYYSTKIQPFDDDRNAGYGEIPALLKQLSSKGVKSQRIDTAQLTEEQIYDAYIRSVTGPTQLKKYRVRQVFGSARNSGWLFGRQVPALIACHPGSEVPEDVLPHVIGGHVTTIKEYLGKLLKEY